MPFETNVFINCPFDKDYVPLLKSLVFTIIYCGFEPQLSITRSGANIRINEIKKLIKGSKYSVHDLSRCKPMKIGELPRFNVPYELGLDIGCFEYGGAKLKRKVILILETEKFHYQKVLSDIAGQDIQDHNDEPKKVIQKVRHWLATNNIHTSFDGPTEIWNSFNLFNSDLNATLSSNFTKHEIEEMSVVEYMKFTKNWVKIKKQYG